MSQHVNKNDVLVVCRLFDVQCRPMSSRLSTGEGYLYTENTVKTMKLQAEELNIDVLNLWHLLAYRLQGHKIPPKIKDIQEIIGVNRK